VAKLNRKRIVLCKHETTYGTDSVPVVGTDALLVRNPDLTPLDAQYEGRDLVRPYLGRSDQLPTTAWYKATFEVELAGMKGLGVATPALSALLRCCGLAETIVASTSVAYAPISDSFESASIYCNYDGLHHKLLGARGSVSIELAKNKIPVLKFNVVGLWSPATDVTPGTPVFTDFKTPVVCNSANTTGFSVHGYTAAPLSALTLDLANALTTHSLINGTDEVLITDRQPAGSLTIQANTVAAKNWLSVIRNATNGALALTHGPATNRVQLAAPKVQLTEPRYSEEDGVVMLQMSTQILPSAGNDEFTLTFL